ncbi:hypothetical protein [Ensifer sp. SSB1]|jgi:tetratricopeptide (TPR) repeat protein|uniref:tetratricopeptide repeat protein n=1 Tax=Ensifer sp. SSB1 TaxID=2795385 RepID=UPI001A3823D9|nr:hypothetical protein [Ensifer sp. SSB1]MBK5571647.1 hypothetical protein [Ensifer sp. SSB1]
MITPDDELASRHTIPRWLSIKESIATGGFTSFAPTVKVPIQADLLRNAHTFLDNEFEKRKSAWLQTRDWYDAEELVSLALVANTWSDGVVLQAAKSLLRSDVSNDSVKRFAQRFLHGALTPTLSALPISEAGMRLEIAKRKRLLRLNPRDALRLTETALLHANLGQLKPSEALIERALILSPDDRYVLRSAARFFVHANQPDRAIAVLSKSRRTLDDPWLNAALLATEAAHGKSPRGWKRAKALLRDGRFTDRDLSELAAQMGTLEIDGGSRKLALRLLRKSAISPTENAVAQIAWVGTHSHVFQPEELLTDLSLSHEAFARSAYHNGAWSDALAASEAWHDIERFSTRPAIFGSFIASIAGTSMARGAALAEAALVANPSNSTLLNNLAVLRAYQGDVDTARLALDKAIASSPALTPALLATSGLVAFRAGNVSEGIEKYQAAIDKAVQSKNADEALRAYCFLGREVSRVDVELVGEFVDNIDRAIEQFKKRGLPPSKEIVLIREELASTKLSFADPSWGPLSNIDVTKVMDFLAGNEP